MKSDIEIARSIELKKIKQVAESVDTPRDEVENYGRYIAKIPTHLIDEEKVKKSNLILVTAITATKAGIGKTTVSIGLALGLVNIVGIPVDNCSVNPARSFGPALWSPEAWPDFWIMVVGPVIGAVIAVLCWKAISGYVKNDKAIE